MLLQQARDLLQRTAAESHDPSEFDLMAGRAGAITGLIVLSQILDDSFLPDFAVRLGDELLETAAKTGVGYSWKTPGLRNRHNLTGFSHGAAGVGSAFLELFHATGEARYRHAASLAYGYERHWFVPECGNWPDFREDPAWPSRRRAPRKFSIFWCHGAPGIALSRLRAYEILGDLACKDEAIAALKTTRGALRAALDSWTGNFSLCHGLAGNAEVLSCAAEYAEQRVGRGRRTGFSGSMLWHGAVCSAQRAMALREPLRRDAKPDVGSCRHWSLLPPPVSAVHPFHSDPPQGGLEPRTC